jgi:hypothetical protein
MRGLDLLLVGPERLRRECEADDREADEQPAVALRSPSRCSRRRPRGRQVEQLELLRDFHRMERAYNEERPAVVREMRFDA